MATLEQQPHDTTGQGALLGQLADRGLLGGLAGVDPATGQHGVGIAVEDPAHHQQLVAADDDSHPARLAPTEGHAELGDRRAGHFLPAFSPVEPVESAATNASWGTSTRPTIFIRFLPSFCFSSSLRLRVMSPP